MAKATTATRKAPKTPAYLTLDEMADMEPIHATEKPPPEFAELLKPKPGVFIRSKAKPTMDFGFEHVDGTRDMWQVLGNGAKEELLTVVPGVSGEEIKPAKGGKAMADMSLPSYRPPWMDQEFLPKLVPFSLSGQETGLPVTRTFLEPRAQEAERVRYPWCTVGRVITRSSVLNGAGSGVLVGPNILLTAGHMIPWGAAAGWSMEFIPAYREGDPVPAPFGSVFVETYRGFAPPNPIQPTGYDYAICKLYQPLGQLLGSMGVQSFENEADYARLRYQSSGYPRTFAGRPAVEFNLSVEDIDNDTPGKELETRLYSTFGWSGGPLWYFAGQSPMAVGTVSGSEKDFLDPQRDVHSGYRALVDLVKWGLDHWRP